MRAPRSSIPCLTAPATVLIVDDDVVILETYAELFQSDGMAVLCAGSAREALVVLRSAVPDIVICDVMMPHVDGIELALQLRNDERLRDVPILLVSALGDRETRIRAREVADDLLVKPVDGLELMLRVRCLLKYRTRVAELHSHVESLRLRNERLEHALVRALESRVLHDVDEREPLAESGTNRFMPQD